MENIISLFQSYGIEIPYIADPIEDNLDEYYPVGYDPIECVLLKFLLRKIKTIGCCSCQIRSSTFNEEEDTDYYGDERTKTYTFRFTQYKKCHACILKLIDFCCRHSCFDFKIIWLDINRVKFARSDPSALLRKIVHCCMDKFHVVSQCDLLYGLIVHEAKQNGNDRFTVEYPWGSIPRYDMFVKLVDYTGQCCLFDLQSAVINLYTGINDNMLAAEKLSLPLDPLGQLILKSNVHRTKYLRLVRIILGVVAKRRRHFAQELTTVICDYICSVYDTAGWYCD